LSLKSSPEVLGDKQVGAGVTDEAPFVGPSASPTLRCAGIREMKANRTSKPRRQPRMPESFRFLSSRADAQGGTARRTEEVGPRTDKGQTLDRRGRLRGGNQVGPLDEDPPDVTVPGFLITQSPPAGDPEPPWKGTPDILPEGSTLESPPGGGATGRLRVSCT
jgi:hypothetical protein